MSKENNIAQLGFGAMRLPQMDSDNPSSIDMEEFTQMVDTFMNQGFNYFDTSYAYHDEHSENAIKKALVERYPRESYRIADKIPTWLLKNESDNERLVNVMLERLGIEYFDVLLIHNINSVFIDIAENANSFEYLKKAKEEGLAKKVGISFHDKAELLEDILKKHSDVLDVIQLQLNYLDWEDQRVQSEKCHEVCLKYGMEITVMEPIKGGTLVNIAKPIQEQFEEYDNSKSLAHWALRFAASQDNVSVVLSGMGNVEQMHENCDTFTNYGKISNEEHDFLMQMAEEIRKTVAINCSYCGYCVKECPMNIPIPDFFNLYNTETIYSLTANHALYGTTSTKHAPASACIKCGKCVDYCTQKLDIPSLLVDVAELFE